ncbi:MAG TPA: hypothetical protein VHB47_17570 [Thermoanaerobaculia bacterium]|jgi:hypothetical protein|nr:hypothetical protein [Thermoanaerobaculia bacterium]
MWRLVKEGLRIYRPVLLSAWTVGTFGPLSVFVVLAHFGVKIDGWQALSWAAAALPVYLLGASAVAGWITIGSELGEHRVRLHALLPLSSGDLALAQLVLPSAMVLFGLPLSHAAAVLARAIHGAPAPWLGPTTLNLVAAHLLLLLQLTLAAKEVTVLRDRFKAGTLLSTLGWIVLFVLFSAETVFGIPNSTLVLLPGLRIGVHNGSLAVCIAATSALAVVTAAFTVALFRRRPLIAR